MLRALLLLCLFGVAHLRVDHSWTLATEGPQQDENFSTSPFDNGNIGNIFDMMQEEMGDAFSEFSGLTMILDNTTDSGLISDAEAVLLIGLEGMCPKKGKCSDLLGCSCKKAFKKLGKECRDLPCRMMQHVFDNAGRVVEDLAKVTSFEGLSGWIADHIFPALQLLCPCNPGVYKAAAKCVLKYDGEFAGPEASKMVRDYGAALDMKSIKSTLELMTSIFCTNNGSCVSEFGKVFVELGTMFDKSLDPDYPDQCHSFRRLSDVILESVATVYLNKGLELSSADYIAVGHMIAEEFWCGNASCSSYLDKVLNTCCTGVLTEKIDLKGLSAILNTLEIILQSVVEVELGIANLDKETKKKILQVINPEKMCKNLYENKICA